MSKTNCINCGAKKELHEIKCPFCGTTYFDFTSIDFTSGDPVACRFMLPMKDSQGRKFKALLTTLAVPQLCNLTVNDELMSINHGLGAPVASYVMSRSVTTDVAFKNIPAPDGTIFRMETKEEVCTK